MLRSWLFVPAHKQNMLDKAVGLDADVLILDLEDGVPADGKDTARANVEKLLAQRTSGAKRFVRVHSVGNPRFLDDVKAAAHAGLDGLILSKTESPQDVREAERALESHMHAGHAPAETGFVAAIESARALLQAPAIATASPRMEGILFGAEDFALDLGLPVEADGESFAYARSAIVVAAAAAGIQAIDRVYPNAKDEDGMRADARAGRKQGFSGKTLIHPVQIPIAHEIFSPTAAEIERAQRIVDAFDAAEKSGSGATLVDGQMIDQPVLERARRVLAQVRNT